MAKGEDEAHKGLATTAFSRVTCNNAVISSELAVRVLRSVEVKVDF
jgi:hypothetical protein